MAMAVAMLVNRAGASMVFFDVVGRFQAQRLIKDADTSMTVFNSIMLDAFANMQDSLNVIGTGFESVVNEVLPLTEAMEDAEIELRKFLTTGEDFEAIADGVREIGAGFGFTGDQALSAAAKMAQLASVLGPGQTETGTQLGMEFGLISGMETEAAMQRLINLNQQLFFMTENTEDLVSADEKALKIRENTLVVMDKLNTIENRSASTMEQVTFVMNQFASQAHLTGESIEMMAAQSAVLIETGEEQGKAGRALRMMYARLGADINGARKELEANNIAVVDANDNLRPLSEILGDLAPKWNTLAQNERQAIAQSVAGNRHYTRFIKLMDNYERATLLASDANAALFPALEEVDQRLEQNITQFRSAEAQLSNYRAELGEELLPALTMVTEKQANLTKVFVDTIAATGGLGDRILAIGLGIKTLVVPFFAAATNVAALAVSLQTARAVTRAMAGEQLMLEEAFGRTNLELIRNLDLNRQKVVLQRSLIPLHDKEINQQGFLLDNANKADQTQLRSAITRLNTQKGILSGIEGEIAKQKLLKLSYKSQQADLKNTDDEYKKLTRSIEAADKELDRLNFRFQEQANAVDRANASVEKYSGKMAGDIVDANDRATTEAQDFNEAMAQQAKAAFAVGGGFLAAGSALTLFSKNETIVRLGMAAQLTGTILLAGAQAKLAAATVIKTAAEKAGIAVGSKTLLQLTKELIAHIRVSMAKDKDTASTVANTAATNANTAAKTANAVASGAQAGASVGAMGAMASGVGTLVLGLGILGAAFLAMRNSAKKADAQLNAMSAPGETIDTTSVNMELFTELVNDQTLSLEDLAKGAREADEAFKELAASSLSAGDAAVSAAGAEANAYNQAYLKRISDSAAMRENLEADIQAILDAQRIDTATISNDPFGAVGSGVSMSQSEFFTQKAISDAKLLIEEEAELIDLIESIGADLGPEAIAEAIRGNAALVVQLVDDSNTATEAIHGVMESATQSLNEFNNAREELFFGMAASNVTGDLVRQVVNKGVENLLVNTEVIMTNNFNGMTTEQVAQEILDHVERGARMRGVDMTTTSQSI